MDIKNYFKQAIDRKASDLHLVGGSQPAVRVDGELIKISEEKLDANELEKALYEIIFGKGKEKFKREKEMDISLEFFGRAFRVNLHYQENKIGVTARLIQDKAPNPEEIGFSEIIYKLTHLNDGLILVTGPSGSGKSTTLAAMINIINKERRAHIITIEDPIEYYFKEEQSIIEQRELGHDTDSFAQALKYALRQDPNVIMVGEMRDLETISAALTAAETGHLVLSTLHTSTAAESIARIVDIFPAHQQQQVLSQLSSTLRAVIAQMLLPKAKGGRIAAREIMINTRAVSNLIRRNQVGQLYSSIQTGHKDGMVTMNKSIEQLYEQGLISGETARNRKRDLETHATYY
ncbi:MAG: PilT/PilU family type 4a pilus ATPase [Patescibacteria group bacterium]